MKKLKRSLILTSSPATTSSTVTNDCVKFIRTISSRLNRGILNSWIIPCSLAISLGHKKAAHTAPSGVLSAIIEDDKMQKRNENWRKELKHKNKCEISISGTPNTSSKTSRTTFYPFLQSTCFPNPEICFFKNFVQRRWVYSVVETTSYEKIKKSETSRKEFWSQTDKPKRKNILKKEPHLLRKTETNDKTRSLCLIHPLFN